MFDCEKVTQVIFGIGPPLQKEMYNFRARVRPTAIGSVRSPVEMRAQALPRTTASQVTSSQALEILSEVSVVPETEVPLSESQRIEEASTPPVLAYEPDRSFVSVRDTPVNLDESMYPLVPVTADSAAVQGPVVGATPTGAPENVILQSVEAKENNTTHIVPLRVNNNAQFPTLTLIVNSAMVQSVVMVVENRRQSQFQTD